MPNRIFRVEPSTRSVEELKSTTFAGNGFLETKDIHEWLVSHPGLLGEDLLVIQREHVNVVGNRRRPDIIAVDRDGNLVVVEVKRDDAGLDIYWQAALYAASYWPRKSSEIVDMYSSYASLDADEARNYLAEHIGAEDATGLEARVNRKQRIILVARTFPREVTTLVLWLNEQGLDVSCLQLTPHFDPASRSYFLQSSFIIPVPETRELIVEVRRTQQERAQRGAEVEERQRDEITHFMLSVAETVDETLTSELKLTKRSRWAGKGDGYRYFKLWYDERPWASDREFYKSTASRPVIRGRFCRSPEASWTREVTQDLVMSNLKSLVGEVASDLFVLFDFAEVSPAVVDELVDGFLGRKV